MVGQLVSFRSVQALSSRFRIGQVRVEQESSKRQADSERATCLCEVNRARFDRSRKWMCGANPSAVRNAYFAGKVKVEVDVEETESEN